MTDLSQYRGWTIVGEAQAVPRPSTGAIDQLRGEGTRRALAQQPDRRGLMREALPGGDEVGAGVSASVDYLRGQVGEVFGGDDAPSWRALYDDYLGLERDRRDASREHRPGASMAAGVVGGMAAGGPGAVAKAGLGLGARVAQGVKSAAPAGAAFGFLEGDGVEERVGTALQGAAIAGVVGGGVPVLGEAVGRLAQGLRYVRGLSGPQANARAAQMLREAMEADGVTMQTLQTLQKSGKPVTLADLGPNARRLVGSATRQGGEARQTVDRFLSDRNLGQYDRMTGDLSSRSGADGAAFSDQAAEIVARRTANARAAYPEIYAQPAPDLSFRALKALETPAGKRALTKAQQMLANQGAPLRDENGKLTVQALDQVQRALRDMADGYSGQRAAEMASSVRGVREKLIEELPDNLRGAMASYASDSALMDAMKAGRQFLKGDAEEISVPLSRMSSDEVQAYRTGAARELLERFGKRADTQDITAVMANPSMRDRLKRVFPDDKTFEEYMTLVDVEKRMAETSRTVRGGSPTAERLAEDERFTEGALGEAASDIIGGQGLGTTATRAVLNAATRGKDRLLSGVNDAVARGVADMATETDLGRLGRGLAQQAPGVGPASVTGAARTSAGAAGGLGRGASTVPEAEPAPLGEYRGWKVIMPMDARAPSQGEGGQPPDAVLGELGAGLGAIGGSMAASSAPGRAGSQRFMNHLVQAESSGDPQARASTSRAVGLTQMTPSTWRALMRRYRPDLVRGKSRDEVLSLRTDPQLSVEMAQRLADEHASTLSRRGLPTTDDALYLAHFAGIGRAMRLLSLPPGTPVERVLSPAQVKANDWLKGRSVGWVRQWAQRKMGMR